MKADLWVRLTFYLAEACALTVPLTVGLLLGQRAARSWGWAVPAVTWPRVGATALLLTVFDTLTGELFGPRVILQYHLTGLVFAVGVVMWIVGLARSR